MNFKIKRSKAFSIARWYVAGSVIGNMNGVEVQELKQTVISLGSIEIILIHKFKIMRY